MDDIYVFDLEGDGLTPTKIHCLVATKDGENFIELTNDDEIKQFINEAKCLIGHEIIRYDLPSIRRLIGVTTEHIRTIDTLPLSWYLFPEESRHGLAHWGEHFGISKPEIEDWHGLTTEEYLHRCREDVKINWKLWLKQKRYLEELYGKDNYHGIVSYLAFKMECAQLQEESKWKLDIEYAKKALAELEKLKEEKTQELISVMPKVPVKRKKTKPAKVIKADGSLSKHGASWFELLDQHKLDKDFDDELEIVVGYDEPNPASGKQVKDWLFSLGWEPDEFKFVKKDNGEIKQIPQINKPFGAGLADSIKLLFEKEPNLEHLDSYYVLGHRIGLLSGFLSSVDSDGYLRARMAGLTNTLRLKHAEIVNLPKINNAHAEAIRGSLIADEGYELCGSDMKSLEDRIKQHFMYEYDPEYVEQMNTPDFDPHLDLAIMAGMLEEGEVTEFKWYKELKEKEEKDKLSEEFLQAMSQVGKTRGIAKNGNYACQYGAGPPRLVLTTGITLAKATTLHKAYWDRNWSVKAVAKAQKVKVVRQQKWLWNPIAKFWYSLRHEKDRFSTLVQGSASFCFDLWLGFILKKRRQLTGQFHDEFILCIKEGNREACINLLNETIEKTNEFLKLNRRLDIDIQFGKRYSEIH